MIFGAHLILFSTDADADRAFLSTVLGLDSVDAGGGWLIFRLPPAEAAVHPDEAPGAGLYLMCDDLPSEMRSLAERGVTLLTRRGGALGDRSRQSLFRAADTSASTSRAIPWPSTRTADPPAPTDPDLACSDGGRTDSGAQGEGRLLEES